MATGAGWQTHGTPAGTGTGSTPARQPSPPASKRSPPASMLYEAGGSTLEYSQDLHLKMSKKIAQLTKVIYALNTRAEEQEEEGEALREAHQEELQHVATETRDKIQHYRSQVCEEAELRRRLAALEESAERHQQMKRAALAEFDMFRQRAEDAQLCSEAQHTQRVVTMSREVEEMRRDFEEQLRSFGAAQAQFEQEKRRAVEELRALHRQEVTELLLSQHDHSASSSEDQEKLAELHRTEVESLMAQVEELTRDKLCVVEEYEVKLSKAQGFYERELEAMRRTQQLTQDNLLAWKTTEVDLRKEFQGQEAALQRTLGKLRAELQRAQEAARESRDNTSRLHTSLTSADGTIKNVQKQVEEAVQDGEIWVMQLKDTEYELEVSRDRVQQQATDILHRASQIGSLQATQMGHEATIRALEGEQGRLAERIQRVEEEREGLLNQSQATDHMHKQQVQVLEQSLREERQGYEKELAGLREQEEEEARRFKEAQVRLLEELEEKHQQEQQEAQRSTEREKELLMEEMSQEFEIQRLSLEEQRNRLQQQLDNLKDELSAKLNIANQEVCHLQEQEKEAELNLGSAHTQISSLKDSQDKLCLELDVTRARVRETSNLLTDLQEEIECEKQQHEARVMSIRTEDKQKMDKMAEDLDQKWTDALREELRLLREELVEDAEEERQTALAQLSHQRELDMMAAREAWTRRVEDLLEQISLLKQSLELQLSQSQASLQALQSQFGQERRSLEAQRQEQQRSHRHHDNRLQEAHCCALAAMEEARQLHIRALEERMVQEAQEEVQGLREAHRRTLGVLRKQTNQELQTLRYELEDEGKAMLASLRSELNHLHATAMEHLRQVHLKENTSAKMELQTTLERTQIQERDLLGRIGDLQREVCSRTGRMAELDQEIHSLNQTVATLTRELEMKGKEVLRVRSEAHHQIRAHEQDLTKRQERDLGEMSAAHHREAQVMLSDFNKAQELLKDKISALQILLEGTEDKFRNRESRLEDLQVIADLRDMVTEREALVKKLVDDKKFYQLELVNRESSFSKVFNTSPNVGVINPLIKPS